LDTKKRRVKATFGRLTHCSYRFVTLAIPTVLHDVFYRNQELMYGLLMKSGAMAIMEYADQVLWRGSCNYHNDSNMERHAGLSSALSLYCEQWGMQNGQWIEPKNPRVLPYL
jgi:hypothetical protein